MSCLKIQPDFCSSVLYSGERRSVIALWHHDDTWTLRIPGTSNINSTVMNVRSHRVLQYEHLNSSPAAMSEFSSFEGTAFLLVRSKGEISLPRFRQEPYGNLGSQRLFRKCIHFLSAEVV